MIPVLTTSKARPNVSIVRGKIISFNIGLMVTSTMDISTETAMAERKLSSLIPGRSQAMKLMIRADTTNR